jgi:hypothetical protein
LLTLSARHKLYGYEFEGVRYDLGDRVGFLTTQMSALRECARYFGVFSAETRKSKSGWRSTSSAIPSSLFAAIPSSLYIAA